MISCVVTTYKRPVNILKRAIDSIVNQTYKDIELIVVNDAPKEERLVKEIAELLQKYDIKKKYIVHECNKGACAARNTGIDVAHGEYLAFLDDDDEWLPNKLERQLEFMKNETVALVYCSHYEIDARGNERIITEPFARNGIYEDEFKCLLCCNYVGSTSYPLLRTSAVREVGKFTVGLKASQDHDLWIRIAQKFKIIYCDEPLVRMHYSTESISRNMDNVMQGFEYLLDKYKSIYLYDKELYNYRLNYISCCCLKFRSYKNFFLYGIRAISVKKFSKYNFMVFEKILKKCLK